MPSCVVKWCRNHTDTKNAEITFHKFPTNEVQRDKWVAAVRLERNEMEWMPSRASKICSVHFQSQDIYAPNGTLRRISKTAVPICTMVRPFHLNVGSGTFGNLSEPSFIKHEPNVNAQELPKPMVQALDQSAKATVQSSTNCDPPQKSRSSVDFENLIESNLLVVKDKPSDTSDKTVAMDPVDKNDAISFLCNARSLPNESIPGLPIALPATREDENLTPILPKPMVQALDQSAKATVQSSTNCDPPQKSRSSVDFENLIESNLLVVKDKPSDTSDKTVAMDPVDKNDAISFLCNARSLPNESIPGLPIALPATREDENLTPILPKPMVQALDQSAKATVQSSTNCDPPQKSRSSVDFENLIESNLLVVKDKPSDTSDKTVAMNPVDKNDAISFLCNARSLPNESIPGLPIALPATREDENLTPIVTSVPNTVLQETAVSETAPMLNIIITEYVYICGKCDYRNATISVINNHLREEHNIINITMSSKIVVECTVRESPIPTDKLTLKRKLSDDDGRLDSAIKRIRYNLQDLDQLPKKPILDDCTYCAECDFNTKARLDFVRHLRQHGEKAHIVPHAMPVNPVPHPETNKKHFDRMIIEEGSPGKTLQGESSSTLKAQKTIIQNILPEKASQYPKYVPERSRYTCGAKGCSYISVDQAMLKWHWEALHSNLTEYHCVHCPPDQQLDTTCSLTAARIIRHLKMHGTNLYECSSCLYFHHTRNRLEKHINDAHEGAGKVMIVRKVSSTPVPVFNVIQPTATAPTMDLKPWQCGLCEFKSLLWPEVTEHCMENHNSKMQFKCPNCPFRSSTAENVSKHKVKSHPASEEDLFYYYYRAGSIPDEADGTPRWKKQRQKMDNPEPEVKTESDPTIASVPLAPLVPISAPPIVDLNKVKKLICEIEIDPTPVPTPDTMQTAVTAPTVDLKPWQCGLCEFNSLLRPEVIEHCMKIHNSKMQFKCPNCPFRTSTAENVSKHKVKSHPESEEDVFYYYYRAGSIPDEADGTPRWKKQRQKMGNPEPEVKPEFEPMIASVPLTPSVPVSTSLIVDFNTIKTDVSDPDGLLSNEADGTLSRQKQRQKIGKPRVNTESESMKYPFVEFHVKKELTDSEGSDAEADGRSETIVGPQPEDKTETESSSTTAASPFPAPIVVKTEFRELETEELCIRYGKFCEPNGLKYKCPLCTVMENRQDVMQTHLFEELKYRRWGGNKRDQNEHIQNIEHRQCTAGAVELPLDNDIQKWVAKLLEHQSSIIEKNRATSSNQDTREPELKSTPAPPTPEKPSAAVVVDDALLETLEKALATLEKACGQLGTPQGMNFCCPTCAYQTKDEVAFKNHLETELNKIRWRCSNCSTIYQIYNEAQLHCKTCTVGPDLALIEAVRNPVLGRSWLNTVIQVKTQAMNATEDLAQQTITDDMVHVPDLLDNSLLVVRYEESVATPEEEMIIKKEEPHP